MDVRSSHLARSGDGLIISDNENRIVSIKPADFSVTELFSAGDKIASLLAASDGSVWAVSGASVFRWKDGNVEEFSIFKDPVKFPARSDMLSKVVETVDGHIWVVASNESHRSYNGMVLEGGLLEWTGSGFRRLSISNEAGKSSTSGYGPWFITGYTVIDKDTAVAGSTEGFALHKGGGLKTLAEAGDISYKTLFESMPLLWLGTDGARLADGTWLFGSAAGLVAYKDGNWSNPERLNQMLPDQYLSAYGARTVHAVSADKAGHIYVGTDRGLLIYDPGVDAGAGDKGLSGM